MFFYIFNAEAFFFLSQISSLRKNVSQALPEEMSYSKDDLFVREARVEVGAIQANYCNGTLSKRDPLCLTERRAECSFISVHHCLSNTEEKP